MVFKQQKKFGGDDFGVTQVWKIPWKTGKQLKLHSCTVHSLGAR